MHDLMTRQAELEAKQAGLGMDRYFHEIDTRIARKEESQTNYGRRMMAAAIPPLAQRISDLIATANTGKAGRRHTAVRYLEQTTPEAAAFMTLKSMLDCVSTTPKAHQVVSRIGHMIELEVRFSRFKSLAPKLFTKVEEQVKNNPFKRKETVFVHVANKFNIDSDWTPWPMRDRVALGFTLMHLALEMVNWFHLATVRVGRIKTRKVLQATPACSEIIQMVKAKSALLTPLHLPMVVPPRPWTNPVDGGYITGLMPTMPLVKRRSAEYLEELTNRKMPAVYSAVNAIQATPWKINTDVLETLKVFWEDGGRVAGLPALSNKPLPPKPLDIDTNEVARRDWKRQASDIHTANAKAVSKRLQLAKILWVAGMFEDDANIYFPCQMDFRGRVYYLPMFLNPQGMDVSKALLTFADGKPIENEEQTAWLAIQGANCWGEDKVAFEDRVQWVRDHRRQIGEVYANPLDNTWWLEADKPWQFLAFCFEWINFLDEGYGFVSRLPVAMDGSNNGLQNFAAMLRDEVSGAAVNLVPSETPQDIYQVVADAVIKQLEKEDKDNLIAQQWLAYGIDRKCTKRPVMVLPYGGTQYSCRAYIFEYINDRTDKGEAHPFGDGIFEATAYLAGLVWAAIGSSVVAARSAMDWLRESARIAAKENLPITWDTPLNFPVLQYYKDYTFTRVRITLGDRINIKIPTPTDKLDKRRQANGISPNFVHSMDATHLLMTVNRAAGAGVTSFGMVHDSYAAPAADAPTLARHLREAFIALYSNDVLADLGESIEAILSDGVELPPLPAKGALDLDDVLQARYFFA